jgi:hypothetical protein
VIVCAALNHASFIVVVNHAQQPLLRYDVPQF